MLIATLGGVLAALGPLVVLLAVGVIGWFVTDAGVHGAPRDGMRMGALAWLAGHGSGLTVLGARITIVPLGVTAISVWSMWRLGHRVGDAVSGHGPDADRISDGERDFTVPIAICTFFAGYAVVAVVVATLAAGTTADPSVPAGPGLDDRDDRPGGRSRDRGRLGARRHLGGLRAGRPSARAPPWRVPCSGRFLRRLRASCSSWRWPSPSATRRR